MKTRKGRRGHASFNYKGEEIKVERAANSEINEKQMQMAILLKMKKIDEQILNISKLLEAKGEGSLKIFKRFLDDIFKVFNGTTKQLHNFLEEMNNIHPTLKFTMTHTSIDDEAAEESNR